MSSQHHSRSLIPCYQPPFDASDLVAALFSMGRRGDFESAFASRIGARLGLAFAYGRVGFLTTLQALGLREAEVILPAFTCPVMAEAVVASGNYPVFVDINPSDYTLDLTALPGALSQRTRAIVVTHLYGYYSDIQKVREIASDERIAILEDCAHRLLPSPTSTATLMSDAAIFSFGRTKAMCTIRGGVVATNSSELYEKIKLLREHGAKQLPAWAGARLWLWWLASYVVYRRSIYGLWQRQRAAVLRRVDETFGPPDHRTIADDGIAFANFQARIGRNQLTRLEARLARRRELARAFDKELQSIPGVWRPPLLKDAAYTFYTVRVPHRDERRFNARMRANGVMVGRTFDCILPELKAYRSLAKGPLARPGTTFTHCRRL